MLSTNDEEISFRFDDLKPRSILFQWNGRTFRLVEPSAAVYANYEAVRSDALIYDPKTGLRVGYKPSWGELEIVLVSGCVREKRGEYFYPLSREEVRDLPANVVSWSFQWCLKASEIKPEDLTGKSSADGRTSSDTPTSSESLSEVLEDGETKSQ